MIVFCLVFFFHEYIRIIAINAHWSCVIPNDKKRHLRASNQSAMSALSHLMTFVLSLEKMQIVVFYFFLNLARGSILSLSVLFD